MSLADSRKAARVRAENRRKAGRLPLWRRRLTQLFLNPIYDWVTAGIVVFNTIFIGLTTDYPNNFWFWLLDFLFIPFVTCEMTLKLYAFGPRNYFRDPWNRFDCAVSMSGWLDVILNKISFFKTNKYIVAVLQLLRIFRIARRLARVARTHKDLRLILSGIISSVKALMSVVIFLIIVHFCFSVTFVILYSDERDDPTVSEFFGSTYRGMISLFQVMTFESWVEGVVHPLESVSPGKLTLFFFFIIITSFGLLNILTAVIVENAIQKANFDVEEVELAAKARRQKVGNFFKKFLSVYLDRSQMFEAIDALDSKTKKNASIIPTSRKWTRLLEAMRLHKATGFGFLRDTEQNDYLTTVKEDFYDDLDVQYDDLDANLVDINDLMEDEQENALLKEYTKQMDNKPSDLVEKALQDPQPVRLAPLLNLKETEKTGLPLASSASSIPPELRKKQSRTSIKGPSRPQTALELKRGQILARASTIQELIFCDPLLWSRFIAQSIGSKVLRPVLSFNELFGLFEFTDPAKYGSVSMPPPWKKSWQKFVDWLKNKPKECMNPLEHPVGLTPYLPASISSKVLAETFSILNVSKEKSLDLYRMMTAGASTVWLNSFPPPHPSVNLEEFERRRKLAVFNKCKSNFIGLALFKKAALARAEVKRRRRQTQMETYQKFADDLNFEVDHHEQQCRFPNDSVSEKLNVNSLSEAIDQNLNLTGHSTSLSSNQDKKREVPILQAPPPPPPPHPLPQGESPPTNDACSGDEDPEGRPKRESLLVEDGFHAAIQQERLSNLSMDNSVRDNVKCEYEAYDNQHETEKKTQKYVKQKTVTVNENFNSRRTFELHSATSKGFNDSSRRSLLTPNSIRVFPLETVVDGSIPCPSTHSLYTATEMKRRGICDLANRTFNALKGVKFVPAINDGTASTNEREIVVDAEIFVSELERTAGEVKGKDLLHLLHGLRAASNDTENELHRVSAGIDALQEDILEAERMCSEYMASSSQFSFFDPEHDSRRKQIQTSRLSNWKEAEDRTDSLSKVNETILKSSQYQNTQQKNDDNRKTIPSSEENDMFSPLYDNTQSNQSQQLNPVSNSSKNNFIFEKQQFITDNISSPKNNILSFSNRNNSFPTSSSHDNEQKQYQQKRPCKISFPAAWSCHSTKPSSLYRFSPATPSDQRVSNPSPPVFFESRPSLSRHLASAVVLPLGSPSNISPSQRNNNHSRGDRQRSEHP